jgi:hypothetical protein
LTTKALPASKMAARAGSNLVNIEARFASSGNTVITNDDA